MIQRLADQDYHFDPADPRAPSLEQWDRMTPAERARPAQRLEHIFLARAAATPLALVIEEHGDVVGPPPAPVP
jgi:hypothetical protein